MNSELEEIKNVAELSEEKHRKISKRKNFFSLSNVCFALTFLLIIIGALVVSNTIRKGGVSAKEAYESARNKASEEAYNRFYETAFASAERKYHVSNHVSIEVASIREEAELEVLRVSDVEYVIKSRETNNDGNEVWMEFSGDGVYTVNMKASEFIIDSDRQYVLVRVPRPELKECRITQTQPLLFERGKLRNGNISEGTKLAEDLRKTGFAKLENYMKSNAKFYKSAKSSAQTVIADFVKGVNKELTDLVVEVEFID